MPKIPKMNLVNLGFNCQGWKLKWKWNLITDNVPQQPKSRGIVQESSTATHHGGDIKSNRCIEEREHAEEVQKLAQPVKISTKRLLPIATGHLRFKQSYLVQTNISSLSNLENKFNTC